jgi:hypothetical protein
LTSAQEAAARINALIPHTQGGSLRFFGEWFGGRRDGYHWIVGAEAESDVLSVGFNEDEMLTVWNPEGIVVSEKEFRIERATRILWEWFYYGRPKLPQNRMRIEYLLRTDGSVRVKDSSDLEHVPDPAACAVEIG